MHVRLHDRLVRDADDGTGGGSPPPPAPPQTPPPPSPPAPAPSSRETTADLRAEAAQYRINARNERERAESAAAELERLRATIDDEKTKVTKPLLTRIERITQRVIDTTVTSAMVAAGLQDPDLVHLASKMPDAPKVTIDDNDEVVGVQELVEKFKKWKPDYFKAAPPPAAGGGSAPPPPRQPTGDGTPPPSGATPPRTDVKRMTKEEYAAWRTKTLRGIPNSRATAAQ